MGRFWHGDDISATSGHVESSSVYAAGRYAYDYHLDAPEYRQRYINIYKYPASSQTHPRRF